ncbi:MAG: hypothetical protein IJS14_05625 [Lentisphaeria bacterium]|nr:hypothetical protein [Lentisphaeria bacterium]
MRDRNQQILFREMVLDLHYRLRLADDLFCGAAESLVSAAALENWGSRGEAVRKIREYSQALQIIHQDFCLVVEEKRAVFPPDLAEWVFDRPDGEAAAQLHLKRLHAIAEGLELVLDRELLQMELHHE